MALTIVLKSFEIKEGCRIKINLVPLIRESQKEPAYRYLQFGKKILIDKLKKWKLGFSNCCYFLK